MRLSKDRPGSDIDGTTTCRMSFGNHLGTRCDNEKAVLLPKSNELLGFGNKKNITFKRKDVHTVGVYFIAYFLRQRMFGVWHTYVSNCWTLAEPFYL